MKISLHWAKRSGPAKDKNGFEWFLTGWAGSNVSISDAEKQAEEKLGSLTQRLSQLDELQHYDYLTERPVREEVIECLGDPDKPRAAITRNRYGALVLNAARVFFADVDLPIAKMAENDPSIRRKGMRKRGPGLSGLVAWLFAGGKRISYAEAVLAQQQTILDLFDSFHSRYPSVNLRLYETAAGYRAIVTNHSVDPGSYQSQEWLEALDSDRLYRILCEKQACYRARLTPKPWRLPAYSRIDFYPDKPDEPDEGMREWLAEYEQQSRAFAVCKIVRVFGDDEMTTEAREVVTLHDRYVINEVAENLA